MNYEDTPYYIIVCSLLLTATNVSVLSADFRSDTNWSAVPLVADCRQFDTCNNSSLNICISASAVHSSIRKYKKAYQAAASNISTDILRCYVIVSEGQNVTDTSLRGTTEVKHQGFYFVQYAAWSRLSHTSGQQDGGIVTNTGQPSNLEQNFFSAISSTTRHEWIYLE
jgi:hypothetical protein